MIQALLRETVAEYESRRPTPWKYEVPIEFHNGLARGVLGFEIEILDAVAAFKLSQDKPNPDRRRVADALAASADSAEVEISRLMALELDGRGVFTDEPVVPVAPDPLIDD